VLRAAGANHLSPSLNERMAGAVLMPLRGCCRRLQGPLQRAAVCPTAVPHAGSARARLTAVASATAVRRGAAQHAVAGAAVCVCGSCRLPAAVCATGRVWLLFRDVIRQGGHRWQRTPASNNCGGVAARRPCAGRVAAVDAGVGSTTKSTQHLDLTDPLSLQGLKQRRLVGTLPDRALTRAELLPPV
jgi:hypothetical protein